MLQGPLPVGDGFYLPRPQMDCLDLGSQVKLSALSNGSLVKGMRDLCQGVHIMAMGWESKIPSILDEAGL